MKEQAAQGSIRRTLALDRPLPETLRKALVPALFVALALLVTMGYGSGVQLNDGQAALHIDPLKYLWHLLHAWNPLLYYGTHTGFWFPYETPYAWAYGVAQLLGISQSFAQHIVVFAVYLGCLASMYYCLRSVAPWLDEISRIAGSCAYLFNMYVALNSQAQIVWLLTYAVLPAMVGVTARAMRGELNIWRGALAIALLVLVGAGINPPLVAINVVVLAIFVAVTILFDPKPYAASSANAALPGRGRRRGDRGQSLLARPVRRLFPRSLAQRRAQRGAVDAQCGDLLCQRAARTRTLGDVRLVRRSRILPVGCSL